MTILKLCKQGGFQTFNQPESNYNKPCIPVDGLYDDIPRKSCVKCGKWLEPERMRQ